MRTLQIDRRTRLQLALQSLTQEKRIIGSAEVRMKLGWVNDDVIEAMIRSHGMPAPTEHRTFSLGRTIYSYTWDREVWDRWFIDRRAWISDIKSNGWTGNVAAIPHHRPPNYRKVTRDWVHREALKRGRVLTHEITIGFRDAGCPHHDPAWLSRQNERDLDIVGPITKKLATKVWRRFINVRHTPEDIFLFCIYPENHTKLGFECRWHFHVELFLSEYEGKLLKIAMPRIRKKLERYLDKYADGRTVSVQMQPVNSGYAGYAQKDAFHNLHMIECNFLDRRISKH
tara:strand:+ start:995 stop:1849 length:855 start_codon:yes stop_codon:yes gene_type:complete